jgi:hypothetical protein
LARSLEPTIDLQRHSDELKNTWSDKFSLPDLPRAAQSGHNRKVCKPSTNIHHLSPKAGKILEDLPQHLRHSIANALASTETSSNSNLDDDYQGSTGFIEFQGMQHFLHVSNYLLDDEPLPDGFIDRFDDYELSWP